MHLQLIRHKPLSLHILHIRRGVPEFRRDEQLHPGGFGCLGEKLDPGLRAIGSAVTSTFRTAELPEGGEEHFNLEGGEGGGERGEGGVVYGDDCGTQGGERGECDAVVCLRVIASQSSMRTVCKSVQEDEYGYGIRTERVRMMTSLILPDDLHLRRASAMGAPIFPAPATANEVKVDMILGLSQCQ